MLGRYGIAPHSTKSLVVLANRRVCLNIKSSLLFIKFVIDNTETYLPSYTEQLCSQILPITDLVIRYLPKWGGWCLVKLFN